MAKKTKSPWLDSRIVPPPKDGTNLIGFWTTVEGSSGVGAKIASWTGGVQNYWIFVASSEPRDPDFWMPLPEIPYHPESERGRMASTLKNGNAHQVGPAIQAEAMQEIVDGTKGK